MCSAKGSSSPNGAASTGTSGQIVAIHLHPDFQDELFELLERWNAVQSYWQFIPLKPPRGIEAKLLSAKVLRAEDAFRLGWEIRSEDRFEDNAGLIQFCEGRLHDEKTFQLFSVTWRSPRPGLISFSTISLRMMRQLAKESHKELTRVPFFSMVVQQLLYALGIASGLKSHNLSRTCIMDYCDEMSDIILGLRVGPRYCPVCTKVLGSRNRNHLMELSAASKVLLTAAKNQQVATRMQLRERRDANADPRTYQVAISFAGEDRNAAKLLADQLTGMSISVFYDGFEKESLWGADLYSYLSDLYRFRAEYCVMLLSQYYASKIWTNHERKAAQARAFEDNRIYILPIRLDDTEIPGILPTVGYLRWEEETPASIARLISRKLNGRGT
jgi:hypothetical protein